MQKRKLHLIFVLFLLSMPINAAVVSIDFNSTPEDYVFISVPVTQYSISSISSEQLNEARIKALGETLQEVIGKSGVLPFPVDTIAKITGSLSTGTTAGLVDALIEFSNFKADSLLAQVPYAGTVYFVAKMEKHLINLAKTVLDAEMADISFKWFLSMPEQQQTEWLAGESVAEMVYPAGMNYSDRNLTDLRMVFQRYVDDEKRYQDWLNGIPLLNDEIAMAKYAAKVHLVDDLDEMDIDIDKEIRIDAQFNNILYYKLKILDGSTRFYQYSDIINPENYFTSDYYAHLKFSNFKNVDWDILLGTYPQGVPVELEIIGAVKDSAGLLVRLDHSLENIFLPGNILKNVPGMSDEYFHSEKFNFRITADSFLEPPVYSKMVDDTHVELSWTKVDYAKSYILYAAAMPYHENSYIYMFDMKDKLNISFDLNPGDHYISAVKSFNDKTSSEFSNVQYIKIDQLELDNAISGTWLSNSTASISMEFTFSGQTQTQNSPPETFVPETVYITQTGSTLKLSFEHGGYLEGTINDNGDIYLKGKAIDQNILNQAYSSGAIITSEDQVFTGRFDGTKIDLSGSLNLNMDMSQNEAGFGVFVIKMNIVLTH